jgi:hypothetical protein
MRDLRHKAFEHVEIVALTVEEIQERKLQARADDHDIQHLSFLFGEFEPRCYLFVVYECVRRLALTGLLIFVYNGSATQVVVGLFIAVISCVEVNQCAGCTRQFFTKSFLSDDAAVLARSSGEEPASPRHRAGVASMAWRTTR